MKIFRLAAVLAFAATALVLTASPSDAARVCSKKTGFCVSVSAQYAGKFQALADDLEAAGATLYYMGGTRRGHCSIASQHPCGWAIDFCQDRRGHVSGARDCNLPRPAQFHAMARARGLYEGSVWCNGDYGHVQARYSGGCEIAAHGTWGHGRTSVTASAHSKHRRTRVVSAASTYELPDLASR